MGNTISLCFAWRDIPVGEVTIATPDPQTGWDVIYIPPGAKMGEGKGDIIAIGVPFYLSAYAIAVGVLRRKRQEIIDKESFG